MSKLRLFSFCSTAALALALVSNAGATTLTLGGTTVANEGVESSVAGTTTVTFDGLTSLPSGFTATGTTPSSALANGSVTNLYTAPVGDTSTFVTTGMGTVTDTLGGVTYFGFYWGSPDAYNTLTLTDSSGATSVYTGATTGIAGTQSVFVNFTSTPGTVFTKAVFTSSVYAFEFDNVTTSAVVTPEPASIALIAGGFLVVAGALRRRKA